MACVISDVDCLYYHSVEKKSANKVRKGCQVLKSLFVNDKTGETMDKIKTDTFFEKILSLKYRWGTPNGT